MTQVGCCIKISSAAVTGCLFLACLPAAGKVADRRDLPVFNVGEYRVFYLTAKNETGLVLHGFKAGAGVLSIKNLKLKKSAHKPDLPAIIIALIACASSSMEPCIL